MKRIRNRERFKRYQQRRIRSALRERRSFVEHRRAKRRAQLGQGRPQHVRERPPRVGPPPGYKLLVAPSVLSMVSNPAESISFVAQLTKLLERKRTVWVSLKNVSRIDYDAIVVLLSVMIRFKAKKIGFNGDFPEDPAARAILEKSQFFKVLYGPAIREQTKYEFGSENSIYTHADKTVDPALSARIIEKAAETVWGQPRRSQGAQRIFLELMQNTNNHASLEGQGEKHWWLSVNHRRDEHKVSFTFVDFGVGVFTSLDNKSPESIWFAWRTKLMTFYTLSDNASILRLILEGHLHRTVTGKYYRGKGLPGIREVLMRNGVSNLLIITNDVYANVATGTYGILRVPFGGTLVYWELEPYNASSNVEDEN